MRTSRTRVGRRTWILLGLSLALLGVLASQVLADNAGSPLIGGRAARHAAVGSGRSSAILPTGPKPAQPAPAPVGSVLVHAAIEPGAIRARLPRSFLGLSTEYWDLPALDADPRALRRVLGLLRVRGDGPVLLRIGGDSADQAYWGSARLASSVPWSYPITRRWLLRLRRIVRAAHLRVILDLNLAAHSPGMAARFARAAEHTLPAHAISAFEIGNEPDIRHHWVDYHLRGRAALQPPWPRTWGHFSPAAYARAFRAYARALSTTAPGIPLAGPALAYPGRDLAWLNAVIASDRRYLGLVTVHRYPLSACGRPGWRNFATIARVLSPQISAGMAPSVAGAVRAARSTGLPVRLTELNSVTCEGRRGVSNTFAPALWVPDALFSMWSSGIDGINIHVREAALNGAFSVTRAGMVARPLLYGLILFQRSLGPQAALVRLRVSRAPVGLRIWAVRTRGRLKVLLLNKGAEPIRLGLRAPTRPEGTVQRLSAPDVRATGHVTLDGQILGPQGRWLGHRSVQSIGRSPNGRFMLDVPPFSGALLTLHL